MDVHNKAIVYSWCREAVVPYRLAMTDKSATGCTLSVPATR